MLRAMILVKGWKEIWLEMKLSTWDCLSERTMDVVTIVWRSLTGGKSSAGDKNDGSSLQQYETGREEVL